MSKSPTIIVYGADWCGDCHRVKSILTTHELDFTYKDIDSDPAIMTEMLALTAGKNIVPTLKIDDKVIEDPDNTTLLAVLGITSAKIETHDVVMIGAGPAALTAAIYTTREDIDTVLFEKGVIGGLAAITDWIDNYPGFPDGVAGLELADSLRKQAERFGADIRLGEVMKITDEGQYKHLHTTDGDFYAKTVLIATGSDYKKLGIPGEEEYFARGVHYCATCDGAFYRDKRLVVVGGGNSAVQEAMFLTRFTTHIDMLVRSDHMRASEVLQKEIKEKFADKITVHYNTTTDKIIGENNVVVAVEGTDVTTGKSVSFKTDGVFTFIGLKPNTGFLKDSAVTVDDIGMIITNERLETSVTGVFAAGDVRSGATLQIASATGEGAKAALHIREFIDEQNRRP
ncbi:MAG: thioredoxin-disulfide reductase [Candidatus Saccharimonadales bacterium]